MHRNITNATTTYLSRYRELIDPKYNHVIYNSLISEHIRIIITRWRLSNHNLRIETGRQEVPYLARHLRICTSCGVLEDEKHAIFLCPMYDEIRPRYLNFLNKYPLINKVFNPCTAEDAVTLGYFLMEIEKKRKELGLE